MPGKLNEIISIFYFSFREHKNALSRVQEIYEQIDCGCCGMLKENLELFKQRAM